MDALDPPSRSLEEYLAELRQRWAALPETHYAAKGKLAVRIRAVERLIAEKKAP